MSRWTPRPERSGCWRSRPQWTWPPSSVPPPTGCRWTEGRSWATASPASKTSSRRTARCGRRTWRRSGSRRRRTPRSSARSSSRGAGGWAPATGRRSASSRTCRPPPRSPTRSPTRPAAACGTCRSRPNGCTGRSKRRVQQRRPPPATGWGRGHQREAARPRQRRRLRGGRARHRQPPRHAARRRADRHQGGVPGGRLRTVHRPRRRPPGQLVPVLGRLRRGRRRLDGRGDGGPGPLGGGGVRGARGDAVRDLHARAGRRGRLHGPRHRHGARGAPVPEREPLPLHGVRHDRGGGARRQAARARGPRAHRRREPRRRRTRVTVDALSAPSAGDPVFHAPRTLEEAFDALAEDGAVALAGGTSVGLLVGQGLLAPTALVWLGRIPGLGSVGVAEGPLSLGATATLASLASDPRVRTAAPALADAAAAVGNTRVRAVATAGGALAHADPRQDLPPALLALDARVEVAGPRGRRELRIDELVCGFMSTDLAPDELITAVRVPAPPGLRSVYLRFTPGSTADYPTVAAAASARRDARGRLLSVTLSLGAVGPTVLAVPEAAALAGERTPSAASVAAVADAAARRARPVATRLGSAAYVRAMAAVWARRALTACLARDLVGSPS